jgi:CheY-like chemotaxis protein
MIPRVARAGFGDLAPPREVLERVLTFMSPRLSPEGPPRHAAELTRSAQRWTRGANSVTASLDAPILVDPDRIRVVVADDHPLFRQGIVRALRIAGGFEIVAEATDGATALALIRRHEPDVAVVDVRMPGIDGIDVISALARSGSDVPVVLLSAFDDESLVAAGLEAGAAG